MAGGLIQDYSKSPIKATEVHPQQPPAHDSATLDASAVSNTDSVTQSTIPRTVLAQPEPPVVLKQQALNPTYAPPYHNMATAGSYGAPALGRDSIETQRDQNAYRQNPMHNSAPADYSDGDGSSREYAERTWKSATQAVSEYTASAGEVAGSALGSIKGWLNQDSKGLH